MNDEQMSVTLRRTARCYRSYSGVKPIDNSALAEQVIEISLPGSVIKVFRNRGVSYGR